MRTLRTGLVAALLPVALSAQQPGAARGAFAGWVQDAAGAKVAGADVTLLSRPLPGRPDLGAADEQRVRTGADGMFRCELLHGRGYSAWATWRDDAGAAQRTFVLEGVFPGPPRALESAPPQSLRSVRVAGAGAWAAKAPLRLTAFSGSENVAVVPLPWDGTPTAELPTLPGPWCDLEVRGRDGMLLGAIQGARLAGQPSATIELPPPRRLEVVVADERGAPIAGALVRHTLGLHSWRDLTAELGRTDAQGALAADVPAANPLFANDPVHAFALLVEAPGRQRTVTWQRWQQVEGGLRLALRPGSELRGCVVGKGGAPLAGLVLLPECYAVGADAETTGLGVPLRAVPLDARGAFTFTSLHPRYDFRLLALLDAAAARAAGMPLRDDIAVAPVLWLATGRPPFGSPHDLGTLRLDRLAVAQVIVRAHDGAPVPGARLAVTTENLYNSPLQYVCDRVGRLQFPVPAGTVRIGAWVEGGGVATRLVTVPVPDGEPGLDPLELALSPTRTVRGNVVDGAGAPVAGVQVYQWDRARVDDRALAELTMHARGRSERTGDDGAFTLTLPLAEATFVLRAFGKVGDVPFSSPELVLAPDERGDGLRLVVAPVTGK